MGWGSQVVPTSFVLVVYRILLHFALSRFHALATVYLVVGPA